RATCLKPKAPGSLVCSTWARKTNSWRPARTAAWGQSRPLSSAGAKNAAGFPPSPFPATNRTGAPLPRPGCTPAELATFAAPGWADGDARVGQPAGGDGGAAADAGGVADGEAGRLQRRAWPGRRGHDAVEPDVAGGGGRCRRVGRRHGADVRPRRTDLRFGPR